MLPLISTKTHSHIIADCRHQSKSREVEAVRCHNVIFVRVGLFESDVSVAQNTVRENQGIH